MLAEVSCSIAFVTVARRADTSGRTLWTSLPHEGTQNRRADNGVYTELSKVLATKCYKQLLLCIGSSKDLCKMVILCTSIEGGKRRIVLTLYVSLSIMFMHYEYRRMVCAVPGSAGFPTR